MGLAIRVNKLEVREIDSQYALLTMKIIRLAHHAASSRTAGARLALDIRHRTCWRDEQTRGRAEKYCQRAAVPDRSAEDDCCSPPCQCSHKKVTAILRPRREIGPRILADARHTPHESSVTIGLQGGYTLSRANESFLRKKWRGISTAGSPKRLRPAATARPEMGSPA